MTADVSALYVFAKLTPPFVSVAAPERIRLPAAEVGLPAVATTTKINISERKPKFEKRILEERLPLTHTRVSDDWFSLLDVGFKDSGIYLLVWVCFTQLHKMLTNNSQDTLDSLLWINRLALRFLIGLILMVHHH